MQKKKQNWQSVYCDNEANSIPIIISHHSSYDMGLHRHSPIRDCINGERNHKLKTFSGIFSSFAGKLVTICPETEFPSEISIDAWTHEHGRYDEVDLVRLHSRVCMSSQQSMMVSVVTMVVFLTKTKLSISMHSSLWIDSFCFSDSQRIYIECTESVHKFPYYCPSNSECSLDGVSKRSWYIERPIWKISSIQVESIPENRIK